MYENYYNFAGELITSMRKTYYNDFKDSLVLQSSINYDLQGRKTSTTVQVNNNNPITTDSLLYNELGQLKNKSLHQQNNNVLENIAYTYNPRGWQLSVSGSMVSDGEFTIKYYENGIPKEISKGSDLTYYVYDALDTKLFSNYLKDSTQFYVDGIEFRGRRNPKPYYIAFEDGYIDSALEFNYYLKDHLGNIRKVINATTSTVTQSTDYYPFGLAISTTGSSNNKYLYNGKEIQSGSGFYDYGARMYDAGVGRWFVVDALAEERDWLSTYNYCQNNPMSRIDPDGALDDYLIHKNGTIDVYLNNSKTDKFYIQDENAISPGSSSKLFYLVAELDKNAQDLVKFPESGVGFFSYGDIENGGFSSGIKNHVYFKEFVGSGDSYIKPQVAAALFGLTYELNSKNITISFGDMSSSNGSDPANGGYGTFHHSGHGHMGVRSGLDVDFRFIGNNGLSYQGLMSDKKFNNKFNLDVYKIAFKYGFDPEKSYQGKIGALIGIVTMGGHNNHGHLGFKKNPSNFNYINQIEEK